MTYDLSVRLATSEDSETIHSWRNRDRVRLVSTNPEPISFDKHSIWFEQNKNSEFSKLLLVEFSQNPVAVFRIENIDVVSNSSSWGCYLGDTELPLGFGSLLPFIALDYGFYSLGLRRMTGQVLSNNSNMLGIHRKMGIEQEGRLRQEILRPDGQYLDVVLFGIFEGEWQQLRNRFFNNLPSNLKNLITPLVELKKWPTLTAY